MAQQNRDQDESLDLMVEQLCKFLVEEDALGYELIMEALNELEIHGFLLVKKIIGR